VKIRAARIWPSPAGTLGALYIDNASQGVFTLEPGSAQGKGPIPAGIYQVVLLPSPHFEASEDPWVKQYASKMPHLVDVPNFTSVMIHWGDLPENTEGCVLVGNIRISATEIGDSRRAFATLYKTMAMAFGRNESVSMEMQDVKVPMPDMVVTDPELGL
jgi:hypothetical protein